MKEGDRNTRFFHKMENAHKKRVAKAKVNGNWLIEEDAIKVGAVGAFQNL